MYEKFFKRLLDFVLSFMALIVLSPILFILIIVGAIAMKGNPFFVQQRPGKKGKDGQEIIFSLLKFRTMNNKRDKDGNLLPDEVRLNGYGKFLRSTSLDELPELINILKGDMAIIGPRPQLVRDMVFMTEEERRRHSVRPGLSGLAQVSGRNNITWEKKFEYDLKYLEKITFLGDVELIFRTIGKVFIQEGIADEGMATSMDLGTWLLLQGKVNQETYDAKQNEAKEMLRM